MNQHEKYMHRCFELAVRGLGRVAPNPMVGCVIVGDNGVIGEGSHEFFGGPHAEINALNSVENKADLQDATLYVNLEPCAHHGKTPPCADAIIASGIKNIVIGCADPNPEVKGKGIEKLTQAGCNVTTGVLEKDCQEVNKRFFVYHERNRPFIILKWAQTSDGFIDRKRTKEESPAKITQDEAEIMVHMWRAQEQAIMVGTHTVIMDNPKLNVRKAHGNSPTRIILDRTLRIPTNSNVFDKSAPTLIFTEQQNISNNGVEYVSVPFDGKLLQNMLTELHKRGIQSVIIEGGEKLLKSFIDKDLWDEAKVFYSNKTLGEGVMAPSFPFPSKGEIRIGDDTLILYRNRHF
ncbi:MAG TPA: bifunctional diaminohydroxyphosphoribosylaminopyrimidine deaminase/5-amino-6-(5-phosphoribosylamino)uracil reductase RibD [Bacteroidia bacterium]|jgi:diaminohydroxyphosphoribosylaminopyrimidine deaminase/5-amino-6-(5-phosphoribosylamino)uracil reductase|nr:bifunctional diaminohydroxyphosphoribosylaminopyrimidine deaminase/5-amino-6-(5-phosphoribosylamino)uracil reductase RibD [Bacteroidia bacterium]